MPRGKSWLPRLPLIVEAIEASPSASFSRLDIEQLFQVARSQAIHLMTIAGAVRPAPGLDAVLSRDNLIYYLRNSPDAQDAMAELARRKSLAQKLQETEQAKALRKVRLPCTSADEWATFHDLPNVSITQGKLTIVFTDALDLGVQLYRLAKAMGAPPPNGWEAFVRLCQQEKLPL